MSCAELLLNSLNLPTYREFDLDLEFSAQTEGVYSDSKDRLKSYTKQSSPSRDTINYTYINMYGIIHRVTGPSVGLQKRDIPALV